MWWAQAEGHIKGLLEDPALQVPEVRWAPEALWQHLDDLECHIRGAPPVGLTVVRQPAAWVPPPPATLPALLPPTLERPTSKPADLPPPLEPAEEKTRSAEAGTIHTFSAYVAKIKCSICSIQLNN
ncbi:hypothetical protein PAPYR_5705 [Paratrimastix pyriformis]|uniref:Uncharacterized protein n=1 Tax=Paratrimastix pyriformis TaxID=342808 RepID=A0ABQ8ULZ0_9EUKA|nr:hypothetical protein PAPYR_5705 [Paratrimastix pyriformis]